MRGLVLPTGFIFTDADIVNTDACTVNTPGLRFSDQNTNAFQARVQYNCWWTATPPPG